MSRLRLLVALAGLAFVAAHVRALPRTLEDIDSINLALGVEDFDVAAHRPHPPGYPILMALSKVSTSVVHLVRPSWDRDRAAAVGLAVWGLLAGALATFVLVEFWLAVGLSPPIAFFAALLSVASPLFWFTASRPLSDTPGLVAAIAVQAGLAGGLRLARGAGVAPSARRWLWAAFGAGLVVGLRSQSMWLTGPLLLWAVGELVIHRRYAEAMRMLGAAAAGVLVWAIPLVWDTGGLGRYLDAVTSQGAQDLSNIELLATTPTWRLLRASLGRAFIDPWQLATLAKVVLAFALFGLVRLIWKRRPVLGLVLLAFGPYFLFHLAFQETVTLRYSLPLLIPVAGLAVIGLSALGVRVAAVGVAAATVASLVIAAPPLKLYAQNGAPVFRAFEDMQRALPAQPEPPVLRMHHQVWHGVLRVIDWYRPYWDVGPQPFPKDREWRDIVGHFAGGRTTAVWFLTDLTRNDVMLFDSRARTLEGRYETAREIRALMGGVRLDGLSWWSIRRPDWMLGSGWSLTPEIAGMTSADHTGPHERPAEAFLRRGEDPRRLMIGGRYAAAPGSPGARVLVELDGRPLTEWTTGPDGPWFLQWIDMPGGIPAGAETYARLAVRAESMRPARPAPLVLLEQFDTARPADVMYAFAEDWHELEEEPRTGQLWRWTSARSTVVVRGAASDLTLVLAGESPRRYFDRAPDVVVRAGTRELGRFSPSSDFTQTIALPAAALAASGGQVTIETSLTFVPGAGGKSPDQRKLGLKMFRVEVLSSPRTATTTRSADSRSAAGALR